MDLTNLTPNCGNKPVIAGAARLPHTFRKCCFKKISDFGARRWEAYSRGKLPQAELKPREPSLPWLKMHWDPLAWMCLTSSPKRLKRQGLQGKACIIQSTQYMISRCVGHSKDWGTPAAEGHAAYPSVRNFPDDGHLRATGRISVG